MTAKLTSKEKIFNTAEFLFMKHGISKVTVEEICAEAEVSKMSFYRAFESKVHLAELILEQMAKEGTERFDTIMTSNLPFAKKIQKVIALKYERSKKVSKQFLTDLYQNQPEVISHLEEFSKKSNQMFVEALKEAQATGQINKELSVEFIMYMLSKYQEKTIDDQFMSMFSSAHQATKALSEFFFYGIFPHDD